MAPDPHLGPPGPRSRRELLRLGGLSAFGASAAMLAACGDDGEEDPERAAREADVAILNTILDLEHMAIAAYGASLRVLSGRARATAELFREHEREHADYLAAAIGSLGGNAMRPKPRRDYASGFPALESRALALDFVADVENTAVAAYLDGLPKVRNNDVRADLAAILTNEAEHVSVLLGVLGRPRLPTALVTGQEP